ncbi:hypothetical protein CH063_13219 [Colletotrichum higginsianum]|uniref:Uncharacterized protein n=1 Tax=Colletotrichum higginsianum (strain IMI 349063) TaxID=759273 RepID=H1VTI9_COLHI|nr:hypothetical protein CH063_13219 [Colletotrichum higginsianum]
MLEPIDPASLTHSIKVPYLMNVPMNLRKVRILWSQSPFLIRLSPRPLGWGDLGASGSRWTASWACSKPR